MKLSRQSLHYVRCQPAIFFKGLVSWQGEVTRVQHTASAIWVSTWVDLAYEPFPLIQPHFGNTSHVVIDDTCGASGERIR